MQTGALTAYLDVAQVVLYVFWLFFAGLILYIRREDRREGYPLISSATGRPRPHSWLFIPEPKTFQLANGNTVAAPRPEIDTRPINAREMAGGPGSPLVPTGDPMMGAIGPGAYALRADVPDVTYEGHNRIVPIRVASDFSIEPRDPDPRGMPVLGADGVQGGVVRDVWVDRSEYIIRYLELEVGAAAAARRVLLPMNFCTVDKANRRVQVDAILGRHFANVPGTRAADRVTLLEEEKIMAYYGGGCLYATPDRAEPLL
jgi:photosynthetic reaction center H subunit